MVSSKVINQMYHTTITKESTFTTAPRASKNIRKPCLTRSSPKITFIQAKKAPSWNWVIPELPAAILADYLRRLFNHRFISQKIRSGKVVKTKIAAVNYVHPGVWKRIGATALVRVKIRGSLEVLIIWPCVPF